MYMVVMSTMRRVAFVSSMCGGTKNTSRRRPMLCLRALGVHPGNHVLFCVFIGCSDCHASMRFVLFNSCACALRSSLFIAGNQWVSAVMCASYPMKARRSASVLRGQTLPSPTSITSLLLCACLVAIMCRSSAFWNASFCFRLYGLFMLPALGAYWFIITVFANSIVITRALVSSVLSCTPKSTDCGRILENIPTPAYPRPPVACFDDQ